MILTFIIETTHTIFTNKTDLTYFEFLRIEDNQSIFYHHRYLTSKKKKYFACSSLFRIPLLRPTTPLHLSLQQLVYNRLLSMNEMEKDSQGKQWTCLEDLHYHFALILNHHILDTNKKKTHFFVEIRRLLNKTAEQCRTHHDKKMNDFKKKVSKNKRDRYLVYKFYYENIKIRKLDEGHLRKEILHFLEDTLTSSERDSKFYKECLQRLDDGFKALELQKNSTQLFQRQGREQQEQSPMNSISSSPQESLRPEPESNRYTAIQPQPEHHHQTQPQIHSPLYNPSIFFSQRQEQNSFFGQ